MTSPIPPAGNNGQHFFTSKDGTVTVKKAHNRSTGIVGPCWSGDNDQIILRNVATNQWFNGNAFTKKCLHHHFQGCRGGGQWELDFFLWLELDPLYLDGVLFKTFGKCLNELPGLSAIGKIYNENVLCDHLSSYFLSSREP